MLTTVSKFEASIFNRKDVSGWGRISVLPFLVEKPRLEMVLKWPAFLVYTAGNLVNNRSPSTQEDFNVGRGVA
jgi:hypothetical protein